MNPSEPRRTTRTAPPASVQAPSLLAEAVGRGEVPPLELLKTTSACREYERLLDKQPLKDRTTHAGWLRLAEAWKKWPATSKEMSRAYARASQSEGMGADGSTPEEMPSWGGLVRGDPNLTAAEVQKAAANRDTGLMVFRRPNERRILLSFAFLQGQICCADSSISHAASDERPMPRSFESNDIQDLLTQALRLQEGSYHFLTRTEAEITAMLPPQEERPLIVGVPHLVLGALHILDAQIEAETLGTGSHPTAG